MLVEMEMYSLHHFIEEVVIDIYVDQHLGTNGLLCEKYMSLLCTCRM